MAGVSDLVKVVANETGMTQVKAKEVLEVICETIQSITNGGDDVRIRGFGNFKVKNYAAKTCRNPQTGDAVIVPAKDKLTFKAA